MVPWAAGLNIASGIAFATLALFLLLVDRRNRRGILLSLFLALWGIQIVAANSPGLLADRTAAVVAVGLTVGASLPLPLFLARFAQAADPARRPGLAFAGGLAAAAVVVALAALVLEPSWILEEVRAQTGGGFAQVYGPGYAVVSSVPFFTVLLLTLAALSTSGERVGAGPQRTTLTVVWAALALYAGYVFPENLAFFLVDIAAGETAVFAWVVLAIGAAGTATIGGLAAQFMRRARLALDPQERRRHLLLTASLLVPASVALLGVLPYALGGSEIELLGLFRLISVGLLFYGILKFRLFGMDLTVRKAAPVLGIAVAPFLVVPLAIGIGADVFDLPAALPVIVALAIAAPLPFLAHRTARSLLPHVEPTEEYLRARRLEVYRAAIETGHTDPKALARRLGLLEDERAAVERVVAASRPDAPPAR
ncbi:MAG: hypothetical protein ACRELA_23970, partial [Candidatus Rokuibacteriota bacterium]